MRLDIWITILSEFRRVQMRFHDESISLEFFVIYASDDFYLLLNSLSSDNYDLFSSHLAQDATLALIVQ